MYKEKTMLSTSYLQSKILHRPKYLYIDVCILCAYLYRVYVLYFADCWHETTMRKTSANYSILRCGIRGATKRNICYTSYKIYSFWGFGSGLPRTADGEGTKKDLM